MKKRNKILLIIFAVIVGIPLLLTFLVLLAIIFKNENEKFVTANFVNFEQIDSITKYRSCYGHNAGRIIDSGEPVSSLKHYVNVNYEDLEEGERVKVYAPFDGRIIGSYSRELDNDKHIFLKPKGSLWAMGFDHVEPFEQVKLGYKFSAGELLGYATINKDHPDIGGFDVETGYVFQLDYGSDSVFNHMTDKTLVQFAEYGVTPENIIVSRDEREANPCECYEGEDTDCRFGTPTNDREHSVKLERLE